MERNIRKVQVHNTCGTWLQGRVKASYDHLVSLFGEPELCAGKVEVEWCLSIDGLVCTIYNWKNGKGYLGESGLYPNEITDWNIGGLKPKAAELVQEMVELSKN